MSEQGAAALAAAKAATPMILALLLAVLTQLPVGDARAAIPAPHLTLMLVYYWSIHRPRLVPPVAVAGIGLFQDVLWGGPPGLNMLVLLIAQIVLSNQQALFTRRSFSVGWAGFSLVAVIAMAVSWIVANLYYATLVPVLPLAEHGLLTILAYPLAGWIFGKVDGLLD